MGLRLLGIEYHAEVDRQDRWWSPCPTCHAGLLKLTELDEYHLDVICDRDCDPATIFAALGGAVRVFLLEKREDKRAA